MENARLAGTENGFTFIELMIVILIFSIGLLSAASMQVSSIYRNAVSIKSTEGSQLATNYAEEVNMQAYETLAEGVTDLTLEGNNGVFFTVRSEIGPEISYSCPETATSFPAREITISVNWDDTSTEINFIKTPVF